MGPALVHCQQGLHPPKLCIDQAVAAPGRRFRRDQFDVLIGREKIRYVLAKRLPGALIDMDGIDICWIVYRPEHPLELRGEAVNEHEIGNHDGPFTKAPGVADDAVQARLIPPSVGRSKEVLQNETPHVSGEMARSYRHMGSGLRFYISLLCLAPPEISRSDEWMRDCVPMPMAAI